MFIIIILLMFIFLDRRGQQHGVREKHMENEDSSANTLKQPITQKMEK